MTDSTGGATTALNQLRRASFIVRLRAYFKKRFPLGASLAAAILVGSTADLMAQWIAGTSSPAFDGVTAIVVTTNFMLMLYLRIADEHKDDQTDKIAYPERLIQQGVITLRELRQLSYVVVGTAAGLHLFVSHRYSAGFLLLLLYAWFMEREFFAGQSLRRHPLVYAALHLAVMPIYGLYVLIMRIGWPLELKVNWQNFMLFAVIIFCVSWVYELGRKVALPSEIPDRESYVHRIGPKRTGGLVLFGMLVGAGATTMLLSNLEVSKGMAWLPFLGGSVTALPFINFVLRPRPGYADTMLGGVALYALAIYLPLAITLYLGMIP